MRDAQTIQIPYLPEEAKWVTYPNGYTFVFVPKRGDVFNISTWVRTGSIHEDDRINGISHFLEHLMFKGTHRFKPGEFDRKMESMGAVINAATWKDFTFYYITGPQGKNGENFATALDMHADMMLHSTIPDKEVGPTYDPFDENYAGEKRERSVVIEEIGMREDQPWTKVYNSVNHMMYAEGHPYQRDVIGTRRIIGDVPRETIVDYYTKWYSAPNLTTIVVGDFEFEHLEAQVLKHFNFDHMNGSAKAMEKSPAGGGEKVRYEEIKGDYTTSFFIIGFHGPDPQNLEETIALDVVSSVLGESRSSRLTQELLEKPKNPVFNMVSCGQSTFKLGNTFYIQGNFAAKNAKKTLTDLQKHVDALLGDKPITEEEFRRALKKLRVSFAETSETASGIAETIGESLTVMNNLDHYLHYLDTLNGLDVDTVNRVARKYLSFDKAYTSVLVPENA